MLVLEAGLDAGYVMD
jgi:hypothetical protein